MEREIYLDNSATTRICPAALERYNEISLGNYGNAASLHARGLSAESVLRDARKTINDTLASRDGTVVFTSGGTESNNLAILGHCRAKARYRGMTVVTTAGEHSSVNAPLAALKEEGFRVVEIPTTGGVLDAATLDAAMDERVCLCTMMLVNNETGAWYDLAAVSALMRRRSPEAILHVDATQGYMKVPFTAKNVGADLVTISSHKIEGPKGVGALWISPDVIRARGVSPTTFGGGQEGGLRSGTVNVPGIGAFAAAAAEWQGDFAARTAHLAGLREYLLQKLSADPELAGIRPNLPPRHAPHIVNVTLPGIKSETMLHFLSGRGIYVSSGSACSSHGGHTSFALGSFGLSDRDADCSIRISFGRQNTQDDVDALCEGLADGCRTLAKMR